ncbi:MAG: DUF1062 domain-containing protein [Pseudomonadota bacterium]
MSGCLSVQWTVTPLTAPEPILSCPGCGAARPFRSSGKFRLNANGKQLDAWLIYNCTSCGTTWNRPIFERRAVRTIDPARLQALQSNDPHHAQAIAFDVHQLRRCATNVREAAGVQVDKQVLRQDGTTWSRMEIAFAVPIPTSMRTDRLLAQELQISRTKVLASASTVTRRQMRRPVRDGLRVTIAREALERSDQV